MKRAVILAALLMAGGARANSLRLGLPVGADSADYAAALNHVVLKPFTRTSHLRVRIVTYPRDVAVKPLRWDVAQLEPIALYTACRTGTIRKIDWQSVGGRARLLPQATSDCGVGAYLQSIVLTWDTARVPGRPNWSDFWNIARLPGKRGLQRTPIGTLEIALMADGVAPNDVYGVLRSSGGPDRAFRKLDQLRPYIVWWDPDNDPLASLAAGKVLMSSAPDTRVMTAERKLHRSFGVQRNGAFTGLQSWTISAATTQVASAAALIEFATNPAVQARMQTQAGFAGTGAVNTENPLAGALLLDASFWSRYGAALTAQFNDWLKR